MGVTAPHVQRHMMQTKVIVKYYHIRRYFIATAVSYHTYSLYAISVSIFFSLSVPRPDSIKALSTFSLTNLVVTFATFVVAVMIKSSVTDFLASPTLVEHERPD